MKIVVMVVVQVLSMEKDVEEAKEEVEAEEGMIGKGSPKSAVTQKRMFSVIIAEDMAIC